MPNRADGRSDGPYAFVDALRGVAALVVVYFHLHLHVFAGYPARAIEPDSATWWIVFGFFDLGKFAVACFFIVSGFLIPTTLDRPGASLRAFALHRFLRLYPALWFALAVFVVVALWRGQRVPWEHLAINATLAQGFVGVRELLGVTWTLQIELIFYGLCGFLFAIKRFERRERYVWAALAAALACAGLRYGLERRFPVALFIALALMFWGDMLRRGLPTRNIAVASCSIVLVLAPTCYLGYQEDARRYWVTYVAAMAVFACLYHRREMFTRTPCAPAFAWLANASYSVYLLQQPLVIVPARAMKAAGWSPWAITMVMLPGLVVVAHLVYRLIEAPCIRLGKRLTGPPKPQAPPTTAP